MPVLLLISACHKRKHPPKEFSKIITIHFFNLFDRFLKSGLTAVAAAIDIL
jgi:hypothetical protein